MKKDFLGVLGLVFLILSGVMMTRFFESLPWASAQGEAVLQPITAGISLPTPEIPPDFDWWTYIQNYPDLGRAGINTEREAKQHWLEFGFHEGRQYKKIAKPAISYDDEVPHDFDWQTYINNYGDLLQSNIHTEIQAIEHWLRIGRKEGRTYKWIPFQPSKVRPDFEWKIYVENYEDLRDAGIDTEEEATEHWLKIGKREGRTCRPLDSLQKRSSFARLKSKNELQNSRESAMEESLRYWTKKTLS